MALTHGRPARKANARAMLVPIGSYLMANPQWPPTNNAYDDMAPIDVVYHYEPGLNNTGSLTNFNQEGRHGA